MQFEVKNTSKENVALEVESGGHAVLKPNEKRTITPKIPYSDERIAELKKAGVTAKPVKAEK